MIIGFGNDLCDIRRIEDSLTRFGERFTRRVFTEVERQKSDGRASRAASYAKRFAARRLARRRWALGCDLASPGARWESSIWRPVNRP